MSKTSSVTVNVVTCGDNSQLMALNIEGCQACERCANSRGRCRRNGSAPPRDTACRRALDKESQWVTVQRSWFEYPEDETPVLASPVCCCCCWWLVALIVVTGASDPAIRFVSNTSLRYQEDNPRGRQLVRILS